MSSELANQLQRFARRQRNRIWLDRVVARSAPLSLYSALVFVLGAGIHQLLLPLNFTLIAAIAILPYLAFLCFLVITQKPAPREGAAAADKLFAANSLFVSAWEITRLRSDIEGTAKLLIKRCAKALPDWSRAPSRPAREKLTPAGLIAVTLATLGLFFLWQPSHVPPRQDAQETVNPSLELASDDSASARELLAGLLDDSSHSTPTAARPGATQTPGGSSASAAVGGSQHSAQPVELDLAAGIPATASSSPAGKPASTLAPASSASGPDGDAKTIDRGAGDQAAEAPDSSVLEAKEYDRIRLIDIETGSDRRSIAGDDTGRGGKLLEPRQAALRPYAGNSRQQVSAGGFSDMLSPQQRNLVWRYFVQLDKIYDPRD